MKNIAYIALGSNLGNRLENLRTALDLMGSQVNVLECSSIYETPPWGYTSQPAFLNQVIKGETDLQAYELLGFLKELETRIGRQATFLYGPRTIDLDILFYNQQVFKTDELIIPHPRIEERAFVLVPLAEIDSGLVHPINGKTTAEMLAELDSTGIIRFETNEKPTCIQDG